MENNMIQISTENSICTITLNNPKALNALDFQMLDNLSSIIDKIELDSSIIVVIITGAGRSFVAGADIQAMAKMNSEQAREFGIKGTSLFSKIENLSKPVIAAVNGYALGGGCELALACDIRVASEKAKFGQPEVSLGITPGFSGTVRLPSTIGIAKAKELVLTGKTIDATEALSIGLINMVVPAEILIDKATEIAKTISKNSPIAVKYSKISLNASSRMCAEEAIRMENNLFALCFSTEDQKEGMQAFIEKRKPNFNQ
ncbi:MAG: enoyl-CoA hydratase-related protein [Bacteroidales bacterium]|nr:enoyl-CoA hydratase-related protein [Bacteroidales bacterium]